LRKLLAYQHDDCLSVAPDPHLPHWIDRELLRAADVLPAECLTGIEPRLLLLTTPDDRNLDRLPEPELLRAYWRLLLQASVMAAIDRELAEGRLTAAACAERLESFGPPAAREIRYVLEAERLAHPEADTAARYRVFAAVLLDLHNFSLHAVGEFFPSLPDHAEAARVVCRDVDAAGLLAASRPAGATDPEPEPSRDERWLAAHEHGAFDPPPLPPPGAPAPMLDRARDQERVGNLVRAAVLCTQAARGAADEAERERARADAQSAIGKLVDRLGDLLGWDDASRHDWRQALSPVLDRAAVGFWPRAARCLYELQKIPADLAGEVYAVDLAETIRTLGRRPLKRPLPRARDVMLLQHLKRAHKQLLRSQVPEPQQHALDRLLHRESHRVESRIRHELTPVITTALQDAGLRPTLRVEEVARDKLVAELLDRVCDRGFLRIGDLRDAIARNQLKMSDVAGPGEFFRGDALLLADERLAYDLDGVYRRGEIYMRWLQRASSLFFGTRIGRPVTRFVLLPLVGALMCVIFAGELREYGTKGYALIQRLAGTKPPPPPPENKEIIQEFEVAANGDILVFFREVVTAAPQAPHKHNVFDEIHWPTVAGLAVFLMLMLNVPPFRRGIFALLRHTGRVVRFFVVELPGRAWRSAPVRAIRRSAAARFVSRYLSGAIIVTAGVLLFEWFVGADGWRMLRFAGLAFATVALLGNTGPGWVAQERFAEKLSDWGRLVRVNLLPGFVAWVLAGFRWLVNWFERQLYAVDEWLRYRGGESKGSLVTKAALGLVWFPIAYITRFAFNLLIEPQVNPIKHFPVVTVSHKVLLPMIPSVATSLAVSEGTAFMIIAGIPGIFGFIAWELLSNWRLYRANRPARLRPAVIGSHGESMRGLLRPGFHSGTVPKVFRKLRHARRASHSRLHHDLEHAAEGVHRFVERELIPLLEGSRDWGGLKVEIGALRFGCQRVVVPLHVPALGRDPFVMAFENRDGRIDAAAEQLGWFDKLTAGQRSAFVAAVRGLIDMSAAELLAGQERAVFTPTLAADPEPLAELRVPYTRDEWVSRWEAAKA
jgi:hypothetical protein